MSKKKIVKKKPPQKKRPAENRKLRYSLGLILSIIAFLIYTNTLNNQYALDDASAITANYVTQQGVSGIPTLLTEHYRFGYWASPGTLYRPVPLIMFALEWQISPDNPGLYHFMNVLLYALTAFLLFWTLCKILPKYSPVFPFLATLLFVCHPVHVEVVANIKSRDEILSFLFCITAVYFLWKYLKMSHYKWLGAAFAAYLFAMFSKENAITFLLVFPLLLYFFTKKNILEIAKTTIFLTVPVAIYLGVRTSILGGLSGKKELAPLLDNFISGAPDMSTRMASAFFMTGKYLWSLFFPHPLGSDFGYNQIPLAGWGDWQVLLTLAVIMGAVYYVVKNFHNKDIISFGILYFAITFSIFSNMLFLIGSSYGDRFMYFPSLGFTMILAFLILKLLKADFTLKSPSLTAFFKNYTVPILVTALIAAAYSFKTVDRNQAWYDSFSLYDTDIKIAPNSAKLNFHYGLELKKKGQDETDPTLKGNYMNRAFQHFSKATEIYPKYADAYGQMGLMHYLNKNYEQALASYEEALKYNKNMPKVYSNMGNIYYERGDLRKAEEVFKKAISLDSRFVDARRNLGSVYAQLKQFDQAIAQFKEALKYDPDNATLYLYLGYAHRDKGDTAGAQQYFEKAYQLDPSLRK